MASPSSRSLARFAAPGVLLLASLALFGGGLLPGRAFYYRDVLHYYWPLQAMHWRLGLVPQWNPFYQGGVPFLADIHAGVLYPPNLLFAVLSFPTAYALVLVLHHFGGQLGLFLFLRRQGFAEAPALTGTLAFGLTGYVAGLCNAGPIVLGLAWMPWVLLALHSRLATVRKLAVLAMLLTVQLISGDPQSAFYSALVSAASLAWFPERRRHLVALGGAGVLALLLAGVQVFPALTLLAESTRGGATVNYLGSWNLHPVRLLELAFPYPFGEYLGVPQFWAWFSVKGTGSVPFALSVYLGVSVLGLGVLGARRERLTGFALTLCALGLLLALGERSPLSALLALPPFRFFRYPEKYIVLVALGCALLAASGARALLEAPSRRRLIPLGLAALLLGGTLVFLQAVPGPALESIAAMLESVRTRRDPQDVLSSATRAMSTSLFFLCGLLGFAGLALRKPGSRAVSVGVLAVVAADLLWTAGSTVWLGPATLYQEPPAVARLRERVGSPPTRLFRLDKELKTSAPQSRSMEGLLKLRRYDQETLKSDLPGAFGLEEVTSYGAVELRRWKALMTALTPQPQKMAELYAGCLLLTSPQAEPASLVAENLAVKRLDPCPSRLRTVTRTTPVASLEEAVTRLTAGKSGGLEEALVEGGAARTYAPAQVDEADWEAGSARARVVAGAGGTFLVFATTSYPGWTASVDGQQVSLSVVDGALMGLEVPEGTHQVVFTFTDPGLALGLLATLAGLLLLGAMGFITRPSRVPPGVHTGTSTR